MKTQLIKTTISSLFFACALVSMVTAIALGTSGVASAQTPNEPSKARGEPWLRQLIVRLATRSGLPSRVC
jgi:hypothetical protein